jgi:hypothetical protein
MNTNQERSAKVSRRRALKKLLINEHEADRLAPENVL